MNRIGGLAAAALFLAARPAFAAEGPERAYLRGLVHEKFGRPSDALAFYRQAAELDPSSRFLQESLASLCLGLGRLDDALKAADAAAALAPKDPASYILLGRVRLARGEKDQAAAAFDRALGIEPSLSEALLYAAYLRSASDPAGALPFLQRYLKENPGSVEAIARIAQLQETLGRTAEAEAGWKEAAGRDPSDPQIQMSLGRLAEARGDFSAAKGFYEAARFLDPDNAQVLLPLGEALYRLGRPDEAKAVLGKAAALDPSDAGALFGLAMIAEDGEDWAEAERRLSAAAKISDIPAVALRLAYVQSMDGRPAAALKTLGVLRKKDPGNPDVLMYMGLADEDLGKTRAALKMFLGCLAVDPTRAEAQYHAAVAWDGLGRFDRAEPLLKEAVRLAPRHAVALNYLGYSWTERGVHLEEARELIRRALKEEPDNPAFLDSMGWCFFKLGRNAEAEEVLARVSRAVDDPTVLEHEGDVLQALGRADEAARAWEEGLLLDPKSRPLRKRLGRRADHFAWGPMTAARSVLKRAEADFVSLRGAAGSVSAVFRRGPASVDAEGVFYYRKPGQFRLEILDAMGLPTALAVGDASGIQVRPEGGMIPPSAREAMGLLGEVLSGAWTRRFDDPSVHVERKGSALFYEGPAGEIEIDGRAKVLARCAARGVTLFLEDYRTLDGVRWPHRIRFRSDAGSFTVTLSFRAPRMNPPLGDDLFTLPPARP